MQIKQVFVRTQSMRRSSRKDDLSLAGFTLLELMVAVGLMVLIISIVAMIFSQTSRVYTNSVDRMNIYASARAVCDRITTDLNGALPKNNPQQLFKINKGTTAQDKKGRSYDKDQISFRTTTSVFGSVRGVEVRYFLIPEVDLTILSQAAQGGTPETTKTKRKLYALRRVVNDFNGTLTLIDEANLCHYVLAMKIEYLDSATKRYQDPPPLGLLIDKNSPPDKKLPGAIRISLRVVAGAAERQERLISKVIWIPMGQ